MANRSLDEFLDDGSTGDPGDDDRTGGADEPGDRGGHDGDGRARDADSDPDPGSDTADGTDGRVDPGEVEPATTTYAATEGECVACGERAAERWRDEAGLVCPDCKEW